MNAGELRRESNVVALKWLFACKIGVGDSGNLLTSLWEMVIELADKLFRLLHGTHNVICLVCWFSILLLYFPFATQSISER